MPVFNQPGNWWDFLGITQDEAEGVDWSQFDPSINSINWGAMQQGYIPGMRQMLPGFRMSPYQQYIRRRAGMFAQTPTNAKQVSPASGSTNPATAVVPPTATGSISYPNMVMTDTTSAAKEPAIVTALRKQIYGS